MMRDAREAYGARAAEYIDLLGDVGAMSPIDRRTMEEWAASIDGRILDAGCGPGHWTAHLRSRGADIEGIDQVPEFIDSARSRFPGTAYRLGGLDALPAEAGELAGILAWYSVIHVDPVNLPDVLAEFARSLAPGGRLLLGFFEGSRVEPFPHAVTTAYFWPTEEMARLLEAAGFRVLEVQTRTDPGCRPHASISAIRTPVGDVRPGGSPTVEG